MNTITSPFICFVASGLCCIACISNAFAEAPPAYVELPLSKLGVPDGPNPEVEIPLIIKDTSVTEFEPVIVHVLKKDGGGQNLGKSFEESFVPGSAGRLPTLVVKPNADLEVGEYTLVMQLTPKPPVASKPPQTLSITLTRQFGDLAVRKGTIFHLQQTRMFWPFTQWPYGNITSGEAANRQLVLEETTHRAAVRDLKFHDDEVKGERNAVVNTKVTVPNGDGSTVKAGDTAEFLPVTDGMFPLGTTEGVLKITSPQMAKALEVDYRVHARWSIWLIPVLCLIGFGLGYVVRRLLETRKLRTNAKRKAYAQLAVLTQAGKEAQDATFRGAIESAKTALQMAAAGRLVEDIDKAVTAATSALQVAKEQLDGSLKELAARVEPWRGMMIAARQLPGLVEKRWLDTQNAFKRVTTLIGLKNPQEADAAFLEMRVNQMLPLVKELAGWRGGMPDLLEELVRWPGAPKDDIPTVVNGWKNEWITANASAAAHRALRDDVTPQTASLELYASETAHQQALQLADLYGRLVKDLAYDSALSLREHVVPKDRAESSGKAMEEASATLADAFADVVGLPLKDAREKLQEALTTHHQAWLANLQSLAGVDNEIEKQAIHDALLKGDYAAAVRVVTKVAPAPANLPEGGPAAMLGIRGDGGNTRFLGFGVPSNNSNPAGMSFPYPAMARAESDEPLYRPLTPGEIHIRILELEQKGIQLEFLQTALLAILFTLAAIAIYHESWVGTWQQVAMVLAWAFATDFTTEKLVAAAKATSLKPV